MCISFSCYTVTLSHFLTPDFFNHVIMRLVYVQKQTLLKFIMSTCFAQTRYCSFVSSFCWNGHTYVSSHFQNLVSHVQEDILSLHFLTSQFFWSRSVHCDRLKQPSVVQSQAVACILMVKNMLCKSPSSNICVFFGIFNTMVSTVIIFSKFKHSGRTSLVKISLSLMYITMPNTP